MIADIKCSLLGDARSKVPYCLSLPSEELVASGLTTGMPEVHNVQV